MNAEKDYCWRAWNGYGCPTCGCNATIETFSDERGPMSGDKARCDCGARGVIDSSGLEVEWGADE